ncbi:lysophospholipid acyltransferase family protein [Jannaschia pohangensis]|uniref:1-acyl-sn-glycerol-3-phosphate acyltransferase n=1 Tax=Jannaschia pohangensis TaxID=390807 RepID=A0A1I3T8N0_9RHOB|nr:lysophospholipid acyltransferase family protein [Jannaschia pohangensis]SFJ66950.1 1-acyl-sn-glycerol-3-phosphate acyltransferase [Jannaschia pohangensis]
MTNRLSAPLTELAATLCAGGIEVFARLVTAVRAEWVGVEPVPGKRVYYANHCSNGDFVLIWTVLPDPLRRATRPVAGADYWTATKLKHFIGRDVFNAVLIDRTGEGPRERPVELMSEALDEGSSLILFPEGTRNLTDAPLLPFRTGLFHLAEARPEVDFVPVWIENLNRVMPKGEVVPIPLLCRVRFGAPLRIEIGEDRDAFLTRTRDALLAMSPEAAK